MLLIDNQLPVALARRLGELGHDVQHVVQVGLDEAADVDVWRRATADRRVVVSKDEDFVYLANRSGDQGRLIWVRLGNCRRAALIDAFERALPAIEEALGSGQRIVELI
jgi:predicted nuclease of predicted toxin-antitoxin system